MLIPVPKLAEEATAGGISAVGAGFIAAAAVGLVAAAAEVIHYFRVHRAAPLAFGPHRHRVNWAAGAAAVRAAGHESVIGTTSALLAFNPYVLAAVAPVLRTVAAGAAAWGLTVLVVLPPKSHKIGEIKAGEYRHLVLVLDVSRSMTVEDAGPDGKQPRRERAADLVQSFFERVQAERYKTTVVAFGKEAKPVVIDTFDREVVRNILSDLPIRHAFKPGDTDLFAGLEEAAKIAKPWPPGSAVLMVVTDGDTVPSTGMPKMPASIGNNVVMVGVGSPTSGKSLGGHTTRQDVSTLRQVAARLAGTYHDGNDKHLTTDLVSKIDERATPKAGPQWTSREYALLCTGAGAGVLAVLPFVLTLVGTGWTPGRRPGAGLQPPTARRRR